MLVKICTGKLPHTLAPHRTHKNRCAVCLQYRLDHPISNEEDQSKQDIIDKATAEWNENNLLKSAQQLQPLTRLLPNQGTQIESPTL